MAKGKALTFDVKLAQAVLTVKARAESLANAEAAKENAISELNKLISKRLKDEDIKKDSKKRLALLDIKENPLESFNLKSEDKLTITPLGLRSLAEKYKSEFSNLKVKEAPAVSSETPASE